MRDTRALASADELAEHVGVPKATLSQWRHRRVGPKWIRIGRHVRYRWSDIEAWLDSQADGGHAA